MTRHLSLLVITLMLHPLVGAAQQKQPTYKELIAQAQAHWKAGKTAQAQEAFSKALLLDPKGVEAHRGLGRVYRARKDWRQAVKFLKEAVELAPGDGLSHFWLGVTYEQRKAYQGLAITHLRKAVGLLPPTATVGDSNLRALAYNRIGGMEMQRNNHAAARKAFLRAHRISKTDPTPLYNLAQMAHHAGRFDEARTWYEKLLELRPKDKRLKAKLERIRKKQKVYRVELRVLADKLQAGQKFGLDQLAFRGYDKKGRIVDFERHWEVSSGLVILKTDPLTIQAKDKPSREEYIYLTDKKTGVFGKARVSISGSPVKLAMSPESVTAYPGQSPVLRLSMVDSAGNRLSAGAVKWHVTQGQNSVDWSVHQLTDNAFRVSIPAKAAVGNYRVQATSGKLTVAGQIKVTQAAGGASTLIRWHSDRDKGLAAARKSKQLVLLYLWDMDSPPCDRMEAETFSSPRVRKSLGEMVTIKLNAANHSELVKVYRIRQIPALVLLTSRGVYVTRHTGYVSASKLLLTLGKLTPRVERLEKKLTELETKVAAEPKSAQPLVDLAAFHASRYADDQAVDAYKKALALKPAEPLGSRCRLSLAYFYIRRGEFAQAEEQVDGVGEQAGKLHQAQARYYKGLCQLYGHQAPEKARATWKQVLAAYPKTTWGNMARKMLIKKFGSDK